ncbi:hypothetical protein MKY96_33445 [Paenibacillus sp. FSL R7-0302]|uniref:hypothetical protein n=1 Tax=Paenibacillus sp. FSL R7-0302 TaxID=2921681 RepID=UPI0030F53DDF
MIKIVSAKFKTDSYNNGDAATWDKKMKECDKISASLEKGCSDLLTSLAIHGYVKTHNENRAIEVVNALMSAGYRSSYKFIAEKEIK